MKKSIIISALFIAIMAYTFFVGYNMGQSHTHSTKNTYYIATETLLDSINSWDESFFDTIFETDTYYEYELAREKYIK